MPEALEPDSDLLLAAVDLMGRAGREGVMRVTGRSMIPTLTPGQRIGVEFGPAPDALRCGDMLVFKQEGSVLVHRILGDATRHGGSRKFRSRGDGVLKLDPPVEPESIIGRVTAFEHGNRWVSATTPGARLYARAMALHDLCWAVVGVVVRWPERKLRRIGVRAPLRGWVQGLDRLLLKIVHPLVFRPLHREVPAPQPVEE
jgi:hypothetical protein